MRPAAPLPPLGGSLRLRNISPSSPATIGVKKTQLIASISSYTGGAAALVAAGLLAGSSSPALAAAAPPALSPPAAPSAPGPSLLGVEPSFPSPLAAPPIFAASAPLPLPTRFPPLPKLALPPYSVTTLPNGLRLFLLEDHEVPLVRGSLLMRGGEYASPKGKAGLASIAAGE